MFSKQKGPRNVLVERLEGFSLKSPLHRDDHYRKSCNPFTLTSITSIVHSLQAEFKYDLQVPEADRKIFVEHVRELVIQHVPQTMAALLKEKNAF